MMRVQKVFRRPATRVRRRRRVKIRFGADIKVFGNPNETLWAIFRFMNRDNSQKNETMSLFSSTRMILPKPTNAGHRYTQTHHARVDADALGRRRPRTRPTTRAVLPAPLRWSDAPRVANATECGGGRRGCATTREPGGTSGSRADDAWGRAFARGWRVGNVQRWTWGRCGDFSSGRGDESVGKRGRGGRLDV